MDLLSATKAGTRYQIQVRKHQVFFAGHDAEGGPDRDLSPIEMFAASLGSCVLLMVDAYCQKHGYTDGDAAVHLTYELGDHPRRITAVTMDLELPRDVPEEKKEAVRRVAETCPVHRTLEIKPRIDLEIL
jgi:putative redox protein